MALLGDLLTVEYRTEPPTCAPSTRTSRTGRQSRCRRLHLGRLAGSGDDHGGVAANRLLPVCKIIIVRSRYDGQFFQHYGLIWQTRPRRGYLQEKPARSPDPDSGVSVGSAGPRLNRATQYSSHGDRRYRKATMAPRARRVRQLVKRGGPSCTISGSRIELDGVDSMDEVVTMAVNLDLEPSGRAPATLESSDSPTEEFPRGTDELLGSVAPLTAARRCARASEPSHQFSVAGTDRVRRAKDMQTAARGSALRLHRDERLQRLWSGAAVRNHNGARVSAEFDPKLILGAVVL